MYIRKTIDVFEIWWSGECVDEFDTRSEARAMVKEYNLAFGGGCYLVAKRRKI